MRALAHPHLVHHLVDFFPQRVTIQEPTITRNSTEEEVKTWANKAGLVDLPCAVASAGMATAAGARETRAVMMSFAVRLFKILIGGYHTAILPTMRAVIDGVNYDILGVEHDTQAVMTRLNVERVV